MEILVVEPLGEGYAIHTGLKTMEKPMVSVLIVTYNQVSYIAEAIESILGQRTQYPYEIIVGDDASRDGTAQIVFDYASRYPGKISVVLQKQNAGATRNSYDIAQRARGKYLASCDGDDCWCDENRMQRQVDFLEAHPEYSAVCGKCRLIDEEGHPLSETSISEKARFWSFDKNLFRWEDFEAWKMPGHGSAMMSRNYYLDGVPRVLVEAHDTVGDRTGVLISLLHGDIFCTKEVVSCYRIRHGSENFMSRYASQNLRHKEVRMMKCLENYAVSEGRKLDLAVIKKYRLIGAVCIWMKDPTKDNFDVICKILEIERNSKEYMTLVVKTLFLKSYYWNTLQKDFPIEVN